ncbi:MAG: phosphoribosylamine--glycine ligase, partial [Okeania sp. SIO2D1]|nr:phosphoribosylamine--glycine ligase [Okeania sp. SIO2D1]
QVFTSLEPAQKYIIEQGVPIVVKADGLAAGKGVTVATTVEQAQTALEVLWQEGFERIVIEECLEGEEVSVFALSDGLTIRPLLSAQDHKRIGEGDTGANTGGMGAYSPAPLVSRELMLKIEQQILKPTLAGLQQRGIDYRGVIYAGLMITPEGQPMVLEFNCRFGDPETQTLLTLLETPLEELLLACTKQQLAQLPPIKWYKGTSVCVVAASGGYPDFYKKGFAITGIDEAEKIGAVVFHAGTASQEGKIITSGGRVLGITATGKSFPEARQQVYQALNCLSFTDMYFRKDIGHRAMS